MVGAWAGQRSRGRRTTSRNPAQAQTWFSLAEPILEQAQARRRHPLRFAAGYPLLCGLGLAVLAGLFLLVNALREENYDLGGDAAAFAVIIVAITGGFVGVRYLQQRNQLVYAGAAWAGDGDGRDQWVTTYDLARIAAKDAPGPAAALLITGANGVTLQLPLGLLEANPALWDLLYNGLRHSAAAGAQVDPASRDVLGLPAPD